MARAATDVFKALLIDVALDGAVAIDKRKLLWLMGKGQDRPSAWEELLDTWEDIGMKPDDLYGTELDNGKVVLFRNSKKPTIEQVKDWGDPL